MDELIKALTAKVGIDDAVAEKAIGIILEFLKREAPAEPVNALIATIPAPMRRSPLPKVAASACSAAA